MITASSRSRFWAVSAAAAITATTIGVTAQQVVSADTNTQTTDRTVFVSVEPCRLVDTRPAPNQVGPRSAKLGSAAVHTVGVQDPTTKCAGSIPVDATSLATNITALGATKQSFLTIWAGGDRPLAASLNPAPGEPPTPNAVTVELSVDQTFSIYNDLGDVHVVVDVVGYYAGHHHDDRYYTKAELDPRLADTYTRAEVDAAIADRYSKDEIDALLAATYSRADVDELLMSLTGDNIIDGSLSVTDLHASATGNTTVDVDVVVEANECSGIIFGVNVVDDAAVGTWLFPHLSGPNGNALGWGLHMVPTVVTDTDSGDGTGITGLVCNTSPFTRTVPEDSTVDWRLVAP